MYIFTLENLINIIKVLYLPSYSAYVIFMPQEEVILSFILTMHQQWRAGRSHLQVLL